MSTSNQSLPAFARDETAHFLRIFVGMALLVGVIALPATVIILGLLPAATGHLVVAIASLIILLTGTWDRQSNKGSTDESNSITFDTSGEAIYVTAILYTLLAGSFSALLIVSAGLGYGISQFGFPTIGLVVAFILAYIDHWGANVTTYLSIVTCSWSGIAYLFRVLSVLFDIPTSLTTEADHQRRNLY